MAKSKESFNRRERERMKRQKADAKRERRLTRDDSEPDGQVEASPTHEVDQSAIIQQLADLNARYDNGDLEFEDFDEQRSKLLSQLAVA